MVPGPKSLLWLFIAFVLTGVGQFGPYGRELALFFFSMWAGYGLWFLITKGWRRQPVVTREAPDSFALGQFGTISITLESRSKRKQRLEIWEDLPADSEAEGLPFQMELGPGETRRLTYRVRFFRRGDAHLGALHVRFTSAGGWLQSIQRIGSGIKLRVFPDYAPVVRYALLALQGRQAATGIRRRRMRGPGADFHQLREYRDGDSITAVDWKATSRRDHLIVKEFQEERNQRITFMVDCGQRMRAIDGGVPLLDHSLNALLLVAYVALRQGDRVAIGSFGGERRWMPPVQGPRGMPLVLKSVYDFQATRSVSDMEGAAREMLSREPRRSLVVILTHLRPEDKEDLIRAHQILSKRHLVLVASMRETRVQEIMDQPVETEEEAWLYATTCHYVQQRVDMIASLRAQGMLALDLLPKELPVALASEYLDVKSAGRL